jgi:DNA-binding MarR family transcriptional regulator
MDYSTREKSGRRSASNAILRQAGRKDRDVAKSDYPFADPEYQLWLHFSRTRTAISKARQMKVGRYTHHNQAAALNMIWSLEGKATPGIISKGLFLQHHTVSELLTRLESKGFIRKQRDEKARNMVRLDITRKGKVYCAEVTQGELIKRIISSLSETEQDQLRALLTKLTDAANREMGKGSADNPVI